MHCRGRRRTFSKMPIKRLLSWMDLSASTPPRATKAWRWHWQRSGKTFLRWWSSWRKRQTRVPSLVWRCSATEEQRLLREARHWGRHSPGKTFRAESEHSSWKAERHHSRAWVVPPNAGGRRAAHWRSAVADAQWNHSPREDNQTTSLRSAVALRGGGENTAKTKHHWLWTEKIEKCFFYKSHYS